MQITAKPATQQAPPFTPKAASNRRGRRSARKPAVATSSKPTTEQVATPIVEEALKTWLDAPSETATTTNPTNPTNLKAKAAGKLKALVKTDSPLSAHAAVFKTKLHKADPLAPKSDVDPTQPTDCTKPLSPKAYKNLKLEAKVRRVVMQQINNILGDGAPRSSMLNCHAPSFSSGVTAMPGRYDLPEPPKSATSTTSAPLCFEDANAQPANLYVNGLPAHTTDDHLLALASRFGNVKSHKAMINKETGLCKGFGFVLYETHAEARSAMLELAHLGLQPSWARESFNSQLRRMADLQSANIYFSNLPKDMGSEGLERLVAPHHILSQRILTDANGASRGVGFVRLRDRSLAEDCISKLNGKVLPGQIIPLQVRFADSEAQKQLKQANHAAKKGAQMTPPLTTFAGSTLANAAGLGFTLYDPYSQAMGNLATTSTGYNPLNLASPGVSIFGLQPGSPLIPVSSMPGYSQSASSYGTSFGTPSGGYSVPAFSTDFSPSSFTGFPSVYSPLSPYSAVGSGITTAATSPSSLHLSGANSPSDAAAANGQGKPRSSRSTPNSRFVPPELAQQHALALMSSWQAQDAFKTFSTPAINRDETPSLLGSMNTTTMTTGAAQPKTNDQHRSVAPLSA